MMMVLFRIGLATFYIGFLLNIFFSLVAFFALILAVSVYIFFPKNYRQYIRIENHFLQNFKIQTNQKVCKFIVGWLYLYCQKNQILQVAFLLRELRLYCLYKRER
jgi:hypothetical protein